MWVEGFFELFATTMVALTFIELGLVSKQMGFAAHFPGCYLDFHGRDHRNRPSLVLLRHDSAEHDAFFPASQHWEVVPLVVLCVEAWSFRKNCTSRPGSDNGKEVLLAPYVHVRRWLLELLSEQVF